MGKSKPAPLQEGRLITGTRVKQVVVPIYGCRYWIIVASDMHGERQKPKWTRTFDCGGDEPFRACVFRNMHLGRFAVFFDARPLPVEVLAHEVFHLTHRILEWAGTNFDPQHHEHAACLHGHLMDEFFAHLVQLVRIDYGGSYRQVKLA